jgi:hypothetical protein
MDVEDPHAWRSLSRESLRTMLADGGAIDPTALRNTVYRGISLGLPRVVESLSWVVFAKTFAWASASETLRGWNVRCHQDPLTSPVRYRVGRDGRPETFGPYRVRALDNDPRPRPYGPGLMIDYGLGGARGALSRMRDPIVSVIPGSTEVLLGWSFAVWGSRAFSTPSYFALFRDRALDHDRPE